MIPAYLINLDQSKDRLLAMQSQLEDLQIRYERIAAIEGLKNQETAAYNYEVGDSLPLCGRALTDGEIGCSMSHLIAYEKIIRNEHPYALIMEDDLWLPPNTTELINDLIDWNKPSHWDIVLLHHTNPSFKKLNTKKINSRLRLATFKRPAASTAGYVISLRAAKVLLKIGLPVRMPADKLTGDKAINNLKICCALTSPFLIGNFASTITERPKDARS